MKLQIVFSLFFLLITISSCSTYQIPVDSFAEQFKDRDPAQLNKVSTLSPFGGTSNYTTNSVEEILCVDKNNNIKKLKKSPSLEIRVTKKNKKRTIFYADQVFVRDSLVCGLKSRILDVKDCIELKDIVLIEIQDGHKNYKYK